MVTPHLLHQLQEALARVLHEHYHADRAIERLIRPFPSSDPRRALIAETVYGVVRHLRRLLWALGRPEAFTTEQLADCIRAWWLLTEHQLPPSLRGGIPPRRVLKERWDNPPSRAISYSVPDWLDRYGSEQCGEQWEQYLAALTEPPRITIRTNTLKTTRDNLLHALAESGIKAHPNPLAPDAITLDEYFNIFTLQEFHKGWFEMQDAASQAISYMLDVEPGMRVIDACAGTGGKTLHLAALMHNRGRIIALDTAAWKLAELRRRAARAGVSIVETRPIVSTKVIKRLSGSADRLLLDLPCSGSGVWRRNPDGKWHLQPEDIQRFQHIQQNILRSYLSMVGPKGIALVCTCSIFPDEGERHIEWLKGTLPGWQVRSSGRFSPSHHDADGFFWAILTRK